MNVLPIQYTISTCGNLGDVICMLSAARTFARFSSAEIFVRQCPDVVSCYGDNVLKVGTVGVKIHLDVYKLHRSGPQEYFENYLGTFLRPLIPKIGELPGFDVPKFPRGQPLCLIQPFAKTARNPDIAYVQTLVNDFHRITGRQLFAVGHPDTPRNIRGLDYSLLENSAVRLMQHISSARCVFTPRSASAHIAAAYGVPAFVWLPDDSENWHLNYAGWVCRKIRFSEGTLYLKQELRYFVTQFLR